MENTPLRGIGVDAHHHGQLVDADGCAPIQHGILARPLSGKLRQPLGGAPAAHDGGIGQHHLVAIPGNLADGDPTALQYQYGDVVDLIGHRDLLLDMPGYRPARIGERRAQGDLEVALGNAGAEFGMGADGLGRGGGDDAGRQIGECSASTNREATATANIVGAGGVGHGHPLAAMSLALASSRAPQSSSGSGGKAAICVMGPKQRTPGGAVACSPPASIHRSMAVGFQRAPDMAPSTGPGKGLIGLAISSVWRR